MAKRVSQRSGPKIPTPPARSHPDGRKLALQARAVLRRALPGPVETADREYIGLGIGPGYKGLVFVITPQRGYVSIGIYDGAALSDPDHLLEGRGKRHCHVKIRHA